MTRYSFIFPGQGAQEIGMGKTFYDAYPEARNVFHEADDILELSLSKTIFSGTNEELTETKTSQPAIFITSCAILAVLEKEFGLTAPFATAGLSLGEYSALFAGKYLDFKNLLLLVKKRADAMHEACQKNQGSMRVVLGLADDDVESCAQSLNRPTEVSCANFNCPGQVVISGTIEGLNALEKILMNSGAKRILPLQVHGAFHSHLMLSAQQKLQPNILEAPLQNSSIPIAMNVSGVIEKDLLKIKDLLIQQVTSPVRWHSCIRSIANSGTELFIEIGPGKTLQGMNKRQSTLPPTISIEQVEDLLLLQKQLS